MKFYPTDWRSDPRLRMCGMAARGLWIEIIALMHEASPYGHLLVSGQSPTDAQLAVLAGAPSEQISDLIGELESAGVFSRTNAGVIYSRKMTRMAKKAAVARKNGKNGGNPSLSKDKDISPSDNQIPTDMDKPQRLEARYHIEREPNGSLSGPSVADIPSSRKRNAYPDDFEAAWKAYPTEPNMSKKEAFDAWKKLGAEDRRAVVASMPSFKAFCKSKPDYPVIHMCRYIAKRRFEGHLAATVPRDIDWNFRVGQFSRDGTWIDSWGPKPGETGCRAPAELQTNAA